MDPFLILAAGLALVVGLIVFVRLHPFLALMAGAFWVSFTSDVPDLIGDAVLYPGGGFGADWGIKFARVFSAFGSMAGKISLLIIFGAVIGTCMTESGAAKRIVLSLCRLMGIKRIPAALMASGFFLSIPVFYDVTFYLLLPLAKAVHRMTGKHYILYLLAIGFGATISHTLIPPTPGPLAVAQGMGISIAEMMLVGTLVGLCTTGPALAAAYIIDRLNPNPEREKGEDDSADNDSASNSRSNETEFSFAEEMPDEGLPSLAASVLPLLIPIILIAFSAVFVLAVNGSRFLWPNNGLVLKNMIFLCGNAEIPLFLAALGSVIVLIRTKGTGRAVLEKLITGSIASAGTIILITSAGGAFGAMLRLSGIGERVSAIAAGSSFSAGILYLILAFLTAMVIKTAQGSSTTAMVTAAGIFSTLGADSGVLGFHPAYLAAAIGAGAMVTGWMNDSGFCIFAGMSGLTETAALKTWTAGLVFLGISSLAAVIILSAVLPLI